MLVVYETVFSHEHKLMLQHITLRILHVSKTE